AVNSQLRTSSVGPCAGLFDQQEAVISELRPQIRPQREGKVRLEVLHVAPAQVVSKTIERMVGGEQVVEFLGAPIGGFAVAGGVIVFKPEFRRDAAAEAIAGLGCQSRGAVRIGSALADLEGVLQIIEKTTAQIAEVPEAQRQNLRRFAYGLLTGNLQPVAQIQQIRLL